jgi:transcriptional regulator with XRE-family HTH domain
MVDELSMPNLGTVLKAEISRLARKEVRAEVETLRKASGTYRREIAELKRQVAQLERRLKQASKARPAAASAPEGEDTATRMRFSAKGLQSLRAKLGLSAADFGALAGVSGQSIYHWEQGKSVPRKSQLPKLASLRGLGKKEARARLESLS